MENLSEREQKLVAVVKMMMSSERGLSLLADAVDQGGQRLLKQVEKTPFSKVVDPLRLAFASEAVIADVETTGLDVVKDGVVQLSMLKIFFDKDGIISIGDFFNKYHDPGIPISDEAGAVTKITEEMIAGKCITDQEVKDFLGNIRVVICHNAKFDRKFLEKHFSGAGFDKMDFHCSLGQVNWPKRGGNGRSLEILALNQGMVYGAHDAYSDVCATAFVLNGKDKDGKTAFAEMYEAGMQPSIMILAKDAPFDTKDFLKNTGYHWSYDGADTGGVRCWYKVVPSNPESLRQEAEVLEKTYLRSVSLNCFEIGPDVLYSARAPQTPYVFSTAELTSFADIARAAADPEPTGAFY